MKTYRNLYPQVWNFENLYLAYRKARKGKRGKVAVADFERRQEEELLVLQDELRQKNYKPGNYHSFYIHEPKKRLISAAPFRDRVVHHAFCQVIEPIWEPRFIHDSYANRVGKGTHRAINRTTEFARKGRYFLQCDVRQFFPSIDHSILRAEISRLILDDDLLWLSDAILNSGVGLPGEESDLNFFPRDDLLAVLRPRGLPIGNLTSQFLANVYLNPLDQFVKRELKCTSYLRYVDDFLLFSDNPKYLLSCKTAIVEKMASLRLMLHENKARINAVSDGIPFLGFRIFPDHRRIKRRKVINYRHKMHRMIRDASLSFEKQSLLRSSLNGWVNHVRYADTRGLQRAIFNFRVPKVAPQ